MNREIRIYDKKYQRWYKDINLRHCLYYGFFMEDNDNFDGLRHDEFEIMSYTGLLDKNGNKVFEGDIVKIIEPKNVLTSDSYDTFEVEFNNVHFGYCLESCFKYEIIGNIHDNPNLIKEEGKEK